MNKDYISNQNSYEGNNPQWIVVHNTDNFEKGADAKAHAQAQHKGHLSGMSAHVFVDDKSVYQAIPYDRGAWHVGVNYGGKLFGAVNNRNSIGVEMCVQSGYDYEKAFLNTVAAVKQIMEELSIDADHVVSHYDVCGKNCPSQIRAKGDWERFKRLIGAENGETPEVTGEVVIDKYYRVRKSWEDGSSQIGAYHEIDNAKSVCGIGYKVYDWNGEVVYENNQETIGTQTVEFANLTEVEAAARLLEICRPIAEKYGLLPSVCAAQTILESGYGYKTELAKAANNVCGMKCKLSGNTWEGSTWDGSSKVRIKTAEQDPSGNAYYIYDDFRKYPNIEDSVADRCAYLLGAKDGDDFRYHGITAIGNYKAQITLIKAGGYATDVDYVSKICSIIERFDLDKYDGEVMTTAPEPVMKYFVRKSWKDEKSQLGAYTELQNAKDKVNENWQWNVYDSAGKEIYNGAKALVDRAVDWMVGIANDDDHGYTNGKWGPEYSCISLVETGFIKAGLKITKSNIDKMPENLIKAGLEECTSEVNLKTGKGFAKGYIPWMQKKNTWHGHVECFIGDGKLVGARGDTDGKSGDSKGNEISIIPYQNMSWQRVFRLPGAYTGEETNGTVSGSTDTIIYRVQAGAYSSEKNATNALKKVRAAGYTDAFIKIEDGMRKIQAWAGSKEGAEKVVAGLKTKGISAIIK